MFCDKCGKPMFNPDDEFYHLETEQILCENCYFEVLISTPQNKIVELPRGW